MQLTLYTREGCPSCLIAKQLLDQSGEPYELREKPEGIVPVLEKDGESHVLYNNSGQWAFLRANIKN